MSIADKLTTIAENQEKVYEAGNEDMLRAMWEAIQCGGTRQNYAKLLNQYMILRNLRTGMILVITTPVDMRVL